MPFPVKSRYRSGRYIPVFQDEEKTLKNGRVITESVDQCKVLPNPELFDLQNQIDAGVDIEEVSSKVLQPRRVDGDSIVRKYVRKEKVNEKTSDN